jgi:hypothetical protein
MNVTLNIFHKLFKKNTEKEQKEKQQKTHDQLYKH